MAYEWQEIPITPDDNRGVAGWFNFPFNEECWEKLHLSEDKLWRYESTGATLNEYQLKHLTHWKDIKPPA